MQISPTMELKIIWALRNYLKELQSNEPFSNDCVETIVNAATTSPCKRLRETVHCYVANHRETLVAKIRAGDFTAISENSNKRCAPAPPQEHPNDPNKPSSARKNLPAKEFQCIRYRQAGRRAKLFAIARAQLTQRLKLPSTVEEFLRLAESAAVLLYHVSDKQNPLGNAESNGKDGDKEVTVDLIGLNADSARSPNSRLSDPTSTQSRCSETSPSRRSSSDEPFLGFSKEMIKNAPSKFEAFYREYIISDDFSQPEPPALTPGSNGLDAQSSEELRYDHVNGDRLLINASELPKEEAYHTEYMIPDNYSHQSPSALTPSSSGLVTPLSEEMSHDRIDGDRLLMTSYEILKEEENHMVYMIPDNSFQPQHMVTNNATNQARKAKLYSELAELMQLSHQTEMDISRLQNNLRELRAQQRQKEHELQGLLQQQ